VELIEGILLSTKHSINLLFLPTNNYNAADTNTC